MMTHPNGDPRDARNATEPTASLLVPLRPTTDAYITCVVCNQADVDFEFFSRTPERRQFQGMHKRCAETVGAFTTTRTIVKNLDPPPPLSDVRSA